MSPESYKPQSADEIAVLELYHRLIEAWNKKNAHAFAHLFSGRATVIGFDGSQMNNQEQIETVLKKIFTDHPTGQYIVKPRDIRHLDKHCLLLLSVAGMIPYGQSSINPSINAIQSLVATKHEDGWYIELFQNTPAQFHGKPEMVTELSNELNELLS
jgi:uncharacterized protein (TIGR02246 family)